MAILQMRDRTDLTLREMMAHLNVIDASIGSVARRLESHGPGAALEVLDRLDVLACSAARLRIREVSGVTHALEALILTSQAKKISDVHEVDASLRHGVDVLMLLTHDARRRLEGYPAADLSGPVDALFERIQRLLTRGAEFGSAA